MVYILLVQTLLSWLNDSLEGRRIIVRDIVEDLFDGQILGELLGKGSLAILTRHMYRVL